jgi:hypothetical protein
MLVNVFKANWPSIHGKCAVTEEELARGGKLVAWLMEVVGLREQGPAELAKSADMRVRAFTRFTRTYDAARRAVGFLRWNEGDADDIIPSLWKGRRNSRAGTRKRASEAPADATVLSAAGVASPAAATAPASGVHAGSDAAAVRLEGPFAG